MKRFVLKFLPVFLCVALISCSSNITNNACVTIVIPEDARASSGRSQLLYTFNLETSDGTLIGTQSGSASNIIKFPDLEPGDYVMNVTGTPKEDPTDIQYDGSEKFSLRAGETKKLSIKMKTLDLFELDDGGIVLTTVAKFGNKTIAETVGSSHYLANLSLLDFEAEMIKKIALKGNISEGFLQTGDTILFSVKGTSDKDISVLYYSINGTDWNTFNAPIKANKEFQIYLPCNSLPLNSFSQWTNGNNFAGFLNLYVNQSDGKPTLSNIEIRIKIYRANKEKNTSTVILNKSCINGEYRYETLLPLKMGCSLVKDSTYTIPLQGNTKRDVDIELAVIDNSNGGYNDISTGANNPRPYTTYKKGEKKTEDFKITMKGNGCNTETLQLQMISPATNQSYKEVFAIYNFAQELKIVN